MNSKNLALSCVVWGWFVLVGSSLPAAESPLADLIAASKSADEPARLKAIDQIGERGEKAAEAVGPLAELLKDGSAQVRAHAARTLGEIGAPAKSAVEALAELLKDPDPTVRRQAIGALARIRPGPQVMVPLCCKLLEDSDPGMRLRILNTIAEAGAQAVPGLTEALKNEKAAYWACLVLREIGPAAKDAVPALVETLKDPRPEIRREAILALAAMEQAAVSAVPQIAAALDEQHTRPAATYALGRIGRIPAEAEAKIRANAKGEDKLSATASLWALARVHPEDKDLLREAVEQLVARLKDQDPYVREAAAHALASLPPAPEITIPIWEKALEDADEATIRQALNAVAQLGAPAVPRLIEALKHEKARIRVAYVLGEIGPGAAPATEALAGLLGDQNEDLVHEALIALAKIGPGAKGAVPALEKVLQQPESSNAPAAAYALGKIGPGAVAAEPALTRLFSSPNRDLALASAWALIQIRPGSSENAGKVVPVLVAGLASPLPHAREMAAKALGSLGPLAKDALPALEKAAQDEDAGVRGAATASLAAIRGPAAPAPEGPAGSIKPGSTVTTSVDAAALTLGSKVIAQLPKGSRLKVLELRESWVGVEADVGGKPTTGWVLRAQIQLP